MDLVSFLQDDHDIIRKFIYELGATETLPVKKKIFSEMLIFIKAHFRAEEMALYSKSLRTTIYELNEMALDGYEEHHLLEDMVYKLKNLTSYDEDLWLATTKDFCQILDLHLAGEEADFYPELKNYFSQIGLDKAAVIYLKAKKSELTLAEQDMSRSPELLNGNQIN